MSEQLAHNKERQKESAGFSTGGFLHARLRLSAGRREHAQVVRVHLRQTGQVQATCVRVCLVSAYQCLPSSPQVLARSRSPPTCYLCMLLQRWRWWPRPSSSPCPRSVNSRRLAGQRERERRAFTFLPLPFVRPLFCGPPLPFVSPLVSCSSVAKKQ